MIKKIISILLLLSVFSNFLFCEENKNYEDVDFPQWTRDLRRTEIIALGSLPFVTLWTTLGYSIVEYGEFRNPLDKSADSFSAEEQKKIIAISAGVCIGLGLTDLLITIIKRKIDKKNTLYQNSIEVIPFSKNQETVELTNTQNRNIYEEKPYLIEGVVEDAIF